MDKPYMLVRYSDHSGNRRTAAIGPFGSDDEMESYAKALALAAMGSVRILREISDPHPGSVIDPGEFRPSPV